MKKVIFLSINSLANLKNILFSSRVKSLIEPSSTLRWNPYLKNIVQLKLHVLFDIVSSFNYQAFDFEM